MCIQCTHRDTLTHRHRCTHVPMDLLQGTEERRQQVHELHLSGEGATTQQSQLPGQHSHEWKDEALSARRTLVFITSPPLLCLLFPPSASPSSHSSSPFPLFSTPTFYLHFPFRCPLSLFSSSSVLHIRGELLEGCRAEETAVPALRSLSSRRDGR